METGIVITYGEAIKSNYYLSSLSGENETKFVQGSGTKKKPFFFVTLRFEV